MSSEVLYPTAPPPRNFWKAEQIAALQRLSAACRALRNGLAAATTGELAQALYASANLAAVEITNWQTTLAFAGPSKVVHHHQLCSAVHLALETGTLQTCRPDPNKLPSLNQCWAPQEVGETSLNELVALPLENEQEVVGTLLVYGSQLYPLSSEDLDLVKWVSAEANSQLEIDRLSSSAGQLAEAELRALRAQISPHFLFNTLNSIAALVRLDAEQARELIVDFASFFRRTLKQHGEFVTLAEELDYVAHYVRFEQVRFGDKLTVEYDIAPDTESVVLPVLTVQPLVENAINHGLAAQIGGGKVEVITRTVANGEVLVTVRDNGIGIEPERLPGLLHPEASKGAGLGMALGNIQARLQRLFGQAYILKIESVAGKSTAVSFRVPRLKQEVS